MMANKIERALRRIPFSWPFFIALLLSAIALLISYSVLGPPKPDDSLRRDFLRVFSHEVGFALLVSAVIWLCFEFYKTAQDDDHWNDRVEQISKNVFFGVWKKNFPDGLIREAGRLILDQTFIRLGLHITYTLMDEVFTDEAGKEVPFVKLNAVATCKIRNVSNAMAKLPIKIALPNPMIDEMKRFCKVNRISIKKDGSEIAEGLHGPDAEFRNALGNDNESRALMFIQEVPLDPNEEVDLILDYNMAKEFEDTEVFTTFFPSDSIVINVHDTGGTKRVVRARSIHSNSLDNDTSAEAEGTYSFKLQQYILPHQGFVIWWKHVPDRPARAPAATS